VIIKPATDKAGQFMGILVRKGVQAVIDLLFTDPVRHIELRKMGALGDVSKELF
jgi:hypothetical protein